MSLSKYSPTRQINSDANFATLHLRHYMQQKNELPIIQIIMPHFSLTLMMCGFIIQFHSTFLKDDTASCDVDKLP
jgi:hypothetical protein